MQPLTIVRLAAGEHVARFEGRPYWQGQWTISRSRGRGDWYVQGHGIAPSTGIGFRRLPEAMSWLIDHVAELAPTNPQPPADDGLPF